MRSPTVISAIGIVVGAPRPDLSLKPNTWRLMASCFVSTRVSSVMAVRQIIATRTAPALLPTTLNESLEGFGGDQGAAAYFEDGQVTLTDQCVEGRAPNA